MLHVIWGQKISQACGWMLACPVPTLDGILILAIWYTICHLHHLMLCQVWTLSLEQTSSHQSWTNERWRPWNDDARYAASQQKYSPTKHSDPLDKIKGITPSSLPPCHVVLRNKICLNNYVATLLKKARVHQPCVLEAEDHRWELNASAYRINWFEGEQLLQNIVDILDEESPDGEDDGSTYSESIWNWGNSMKKDHTYDKFNMHIISVGNYEYMRHHVFKCMWWKTWQLNVFIVNDDDVISIASSGQVKISYVNV